jgi:type IV secretion system protein TrbL
VCLLVVAAAVVLWIELLMREAAVYVIVLMLPLAFAAMVWPARRIWAIRAVELLVALVISKFAIVAVLSLGGAALSSGANLGNHSITDVLIGLVLLLMGAFTPWALLRLLPLAEIGASAASSLSSQTRTRARAASELASGIATPAADWAEATVASMQRDASGVSSGPPCVRAQPQLPPKATTAGGGSEDSSEPVSEPPEPDPEPHPDPVHNVSDVPIDEMHKPEHTGDWPL